MKTLCARLLPGLAALMVATVAARAQFTYTNNNGAITITGYTGPGGAVIIPETIGGLPVTSIGGAAFLNCRSLTSVTIPNSVTNIEDGGDIRSMDWHGAFMRCTSLTNIVIPDSVVSVGSYAFAIAGLQAASIGNGVARIGAGAFSLCSLWSSLTTVYFNGDLPSTSTDGFFSTPFDGTSLNAIYYRAGAAGWGTTFAGIPTVAFGSMGAVAFSADQTYNAAPLTVSFTSAAIDSGGYGISSWAWAFGDGSTSSAPNPTHTYTNVGTYYPTLIVTNSVGAAVPGYGPTITAVNPAALLTYTTNDNSVTITGYVGPGGALAVPGTINGLPVTGIGTNAFAGSGLTTITIPDSVTNIGDSAFFNCHSLTNITFGGSVVTIGAYAFSGTYSAAGFGGPVSGLQGCPLTSITIPDSVTTIGDHAFYWCSSLTNVFLDSGVTNINIGESAFAGCPLVAIEVAAGNPAYSSVAGVLFNRNQTTLIEYPSGLGGSYTISNSVTDIESNAFSGYPGLTTISIPDTVTNVGDYAFFDCSGLTNVSLGSNVVSIGAYAFSGCALTSIVIPDSVTSIGQEAFAGSGLTSVAIPSSVTNIGAEAFYGGCCLASFTVDTQNPSYSSLDGALFNKSQTVFIQCPPAGTAGSYTIPSTVTLIGDGAFVNCQMTDVTIGSSVVSIGTNAFAGSGLTTITIPDSVTNIGDYAFFDCGGLSNVSLGSNVVNIGAYAFAGTSLRSVVIPNSVTNIGSNAFAGCPLVAIEVAAGNSAYSSVAGVLFNRNQTTLVEYPGGLGGNYTVPNSVTNIGDYAFYDCTGLTNVVLDTGLVRIGAYAFNGEVSYYSDRGFINLACPLTSITIPNSVTSIGDAAFSGCLGLSNLFFLGSAPRAGANVFGPVASYLDPTTAYYLPGSSGWGEFATNTGIQTAFWTLPYPLLLQVSVGVQSNQFGFLVSWATNLSVVVEASTDLAKNTWTPVVTNALNNGVVNFTNPQWTKYPSRFYRVRSQ